MAVTQATRTERVATGRRPRVWPRAIAGFLAGIIIGSVLCAGIAGAGLVAWDARYEGRVLPGISVGGVNLSGLDRDEAGAALAAAFEDYGDGRVVVRTSAGDVTVPYADFARRPDVDAMVDSALAAGRSGSPAERALAQIQLARTGLDLEPRMVLDETALTEAVERGVARLERPAIDSTVTMRDGAVQTTPAQVGRTFAAAEAATAALDVVRRLDAPSEVVVTAAMTELQPTLGDDQALAVKSAAERMVADVVVTYGKKTWTIKASTVRTWLRLEQRADGLAWPVVDTTTIPASLKSVTKAVSLAPVSAGYLKTKSGKVIGVVAAADGRRLDEAATVAAIADAITERARGATAQPVKAVVAKVPPKITTAEAQKRGSLMVMLGSWKTWFPVSERNFYGANIWLPAKFIDGTVLMPGQTFEWWRAVGPVTRARGFGLGGFIAGDHTEPTGAMGGGMCSSSTTLFNAALRAGLQMGERSNHRYWINRYPLGLDATVSDSQTMSFTNDKATPIVIRTHRYTASGKGWVRYEIWGVPDGRKVTIGKAIVTNRQHATTKTVKVSSLPTGVRKQTEYPSDGMNVSVTRVVRDRNGAVIHRETYRSQYTLWNGRIEVGR
jgi:vancomycin resistance protein YoaR